METDLLGCSRAAALQRAYIGAAGTLLWALYKNIWLRQITICFNKLTHPDESSNYQWSKRVYHRRIDLSHRRPDADLTAPSAAPLTPIILKYFKRFKCINSPLPWIKLGSYKWQLYVPSPCYILFSWRPWVDAHVAYRVLSHSLKIGAQTRRGIKRHRCRGNVSLWWVWCN